VKYMLLIYSNENAWTPEERAECMADSLALCHELNAKGQYLGASPLHSIATATTLRVRNGKSVVTDGPFAETTEQLGGYFVIDVEDLDEAISIAARIPSSPKSTIEIRPVFELDGLPSTGA
jgi:hypothetical protein